MVELSVIGIISILINSEEITVIWYNLNHSCTLLMSFMFVVDLLKIELLAWNIAKSVNHFQKYK